MRTTKTTDFAEALGKYFTDYLPIQKNVSRNTIISYRDTFKSLLFYLQNELGINVESISISDFKSELILNFLNWLEKSKSNSIATRNQRLAAIHSFVRFCIVENPDKILELQRILAIGPKRKIEKTIPYLTETQVKNLLQQPNRKSKKGRRALTLLSLMYETGARVQEIIDLEVEDLHLEGKSPYVILTGKGRKRRKVPISEKNRDIVLNYVQENKLDSIFNSKNPLFFNSRNEKLTRAGVGYILKKYASFARENDFEFPKHVHNHMLRHSRAVHLLSSGTPLIVIRDLLGHSDVKTTQIYARIEMTAKNAAVNSVSLIESEPDLKDWRMMPNLMAFLESL